MTTSNPHRIAAMVVGAVVMGLAVGIVIGLFLAELPEGNRDVAMVVLGIAVGWASSVVNFHYGSSSGSSRKTDMLAAQSKEMEP